MSKSNRLPTNPRVVPLVSALEQVAPLSAKKIIVGMALGSVEGIRKSTLTIGDAERLVFNLDVLLFCERRLHDAALCEIIRYGMELGDVQQLVPGKQAFMDACREISTFLRRMETGKKPRTRPAVSSLGAPKKARGSIKDFALKGTALTHA